MLKLCKNQIRKKIIKFFLYNYDVALLILVCLNQRIEPAFDFSILQIKQIPIRILPGDLVSF